jgi:hypothetical protein
MPGKLPQVVKRLPTEYVLWYEIVSRQMDEVILLSFGCKVHGVKWAQ